MTRNHLHFEDCYLHNKDLLLAHRLLARIRVEGSLTLSCRWKQLLHLHAGVRQPDIIPPHLKRGNLVPCQLSPNERDEPAKVAWQRQLAINLITDDWQGWQVGAKPAGKNLHSLYI